MTELTVTTPAEAEQMATDNATWNFWVSIADTVFIMAGLSLVSRDTVMPVMVAQLTDSKVAIGLIAAIFNLGMYLPQLLVANVTERMRYKLPLLVWCSSIFERGPYLAMALVIWWLADSSPGLALILYFVLLAISATSVGLMIPAWYDMIAKVIAVDRRGRYSGIGHALGALLGVAGAWFVGRTLDTVAFPNNFALLFLVSCAIMFISWFALLLTREPPSITTKQHIPLARFLGELPSILARDRNYMRYIISRTVLQFGMMASSFYIGFGKENFAITGADIGLFTGTLIATQAVMCLVWGFVADHYGYKTVLVGGAFALALAPLSALLAPSQGWLIAPFVMLGIYSGADYVASLNIILEFSAPEDRPTYIGLTNTLFAPALTFGPLIGGWLAGSVGYQGLFVVALTAALIGGLTMMVWVSEPRKPVVQGA